MGIFSRSSNSTPAPVAEPVLTREQLTEIAKHQQNSLNESQQSAQGRGPAMQNGRAERVID